MQLESNQIHVWSTDLMITPQQEETQLLLLNSDERNRAMRFRFPIHKRRFIAARHGLRRVLSLYLDIAPHEIEFSFTEHNKPYLAMPAHRQIQFNLTHSDDMAAYAITLDHPVGIDIEKIQAHYNPDVAKRFFSPQEYHSLIQLPEQDQPPAFYRLWSRKEALIKAVGKGLSIPLSSFSVAAIDTAETIFIEGENWTLIPLALSPQFCSALASNQIIKQVVLSHITENGHKLDNIFTL